MRILPTDLQILNTIYNQYYDKFISFSKNDSDRSSKILIPIDITLIAKKLKVDVDGVDFDVLKGSTDALNTVNSLVIEYMPKSETRTEIHNFLSDRGLTFDFDSVGEHSWGTVDGFFSKKS